MSYCLSRGEGQGSAEVLREEARSIRTGGRAAQWRVAGIMPAVQLSMLPTSFSLSGAPHKPFRLVPLVRMLSRS